MDILDIMNDFVLSYLSEYKQEQVIQGYYNRASLPADVPFIVIELNGAERVGTNVETNTDDERILKKLMRYTVYIDFIGADGAEMNSAASIMETIARSGAAVSFFKETGVTVLFAGQVQYLPYADETDQWRHRFRVPIVVSRWEETRLAEASACHLSASIENIDVHHK